MVSSTGDIWLLTMPIHRDAVPRSAEVASDGTVTYIPNVQDARYLLLDQLDRVVLSKPGQIFRVQLDGTRTVLAGDPFDGRSGEGHPGGRG